jgi:hypothetical protein
MLVEGVSRPDLRREPRTPADGTVLLSFSQFVRQDVTGQLLDVSSNGFRASHNCPDLSTGLTVQFSHPAGSGIARVVWNRITGNRVESGFFILPDSRRR